MRRTEDKIFDWIESYCISDAYLLTKTNFEYVSFLFKKEIEAELLALCDKTENEQGRLLVKEYFKEEK